ncbi:hydrogen peroxide-inducible genes activator [Riemerella columbina]|uniref:hydrogen peroxide-inducible genes activator n=1 Tax=Riemerella columbina TaxID=103810 RepID=UPI00266FF726|nr:hydrogen peroxide-inducible genes activator [Riemerella columbina]WKS95070.1 LysR substrate-binding domain-containing protein [Riemerella columbina]
MNIQQLEYLIAVDKHKHFGKAAQACFITQPTLSAMIQKLEEELDLKIFDRSQHPIRTTDAGKEILKYAYKIMEEVNEMKITANELNHMVAGKITLGIIPTLAPFILPYEIFDFLEQHSNIEMEVKEMSTDNIIKALKNGEIDAGIIATPYQKADEFFQDNLFNEELMVYSTLESKETQDDQFILPQDLDLEKVWLLEEGNCLSTQFENICNLKENHLKPQNLNFKASSISTLLQMVDKLGGITLLPELATKHIPEEKKDRISRFRKPVPYREISLIYYKPTYKQKILDELKQSLHQSIKQNLGYYQTPEDYINIKPE